MIKNIFNIIIIIFIGFYFLRSKEYSGEVLVFLLNFSILFIFIIFLDKFISKLNIRENFNEYLLMDSLIKYLIFKLLYWCNNLSFFFFYNFKLLIYFDIFFIFNFLLKKFNIWKLKFYIEKNLIYIYKYIIFFYLNFFYNSYNKLISLNEKKR